MEEKNFIEKKNILIELINISLNRANLPKEEMYDLNWLLKIINEYSYNNKLQMKGTMTYTIIDSLTITDETIKEKCYQFDNAI